MIDTSMPSFKIAYIKYMNFHKGLLYFEKLQSPSLHIPDICPEGMALSHC